MLATAHNIYIQPNPLNILKLSSPLDSTPFLVDRNDIVADSALSLRSRHDSRSIQHGLMWQLNQFLWIRGEEKRSNETIEHKRAVSDQGR